MCVGCGGDLTSKNEKHCFSSHLEKRCRWSLLTEEIFHQQLSSRVKTRRLNSCRRWGGRGDWGLRGRGCWGCRFVSLCSQGQVSPHSEHQTGLNCSRGELSFFPLLLFCFGFFFQNLKPFTEEFPPPPHPSPAPPPSLVLPSALAGSTSLDVCLGCSYFLKSNQEASLSLSLPFSSSRGCF